MKDPLLVFIFWPCCNTIQQTDWGSVFFLLCACVAVWQPAAPFFVFCLCFSRRSSTNQTSNFNSLSNTISSSLD